MSLRAAFLSIAVSACVMGSLTALIALSPTLLFGLHIGVIQRILVTVSIFALFILAALRLAQLFRRRLYEIEEAASLVAQGHLHSRIENFGDDDEIGRISTAFNEMAQTVEQQVQLLQRLADENRQLAREAELAAIAEERQRLARDLHDSVNQELFAIAMMAETAIRQEAGVKTALPDTLRKMADLATMAQREMRALLLQLRPLELEGKSFLEASVEFLAAVEARHHIPCRFEAEMKADLSPLLEEELFRILQEALANALKHAQATEIHVRITDTSNTISLTISDNGIGFKERRIEPGHYGFQAMRERAERLGGRLDILQRDPGTIVQALIPQMKEVGE